MCPPLLKHPPQRPQGGACPLFGLSPQALGVVLPQWHCSAPPRRGVCGGYRPPFPPRLPRGHNLPLQKATRPVGENQIDRRAEASSRVVIAMANLHNYPASCCETHLQVRWGGSSSGEGRSVKKICLWHIFSVGRSGYAASKPWFLWRIVRGGSKGERETEIPLPPSRPFGYFPGGGKVTRGVGAEPPQG